MTSKNNNPISMFIIALFIFITFNINAFPRICHNGSGSGYDGGSGGESLDGKDLAACSITIETYVIEGAGYYLKGNSYIQSILYRVEFKDFYGVDDWEFTYLVNRALENITMARQTYERLISKAEATPYNLAVIQKLKNFDYDRYMEQNSLNPVIFKELASYLSLGDITGTFKRTYARMCTIENLLFSIKEGMSIDRLPELPVFWKLNEICSEMTLFGSYAARVFHEFN